MLPLFEDREVHESSELIPLDRKVCRGVIQEWGRRKTKVTIKGVGSGEQKRTLLVLGSRGLWLA